jgi:hypothetical protein
MFDFLKRAIGMAGAYSAGKTYEQSYQLAQLSTIIYLHKQWDGDDADRMATCVWSYLFCTEPTDQGLLEFRERWKSEISIWGSDLLDTDRPFREVIVSSLWVALAVARSRSDHVAFERIMSSTVFIQYSTTYPMLPHDRYSALVEGWSREYSPMAPPK